MNIVQNMMPQSSNPFHESANVQTNTSRKKNNFSRLMEGQMQQETNRLTMQQATESNETPVDEETRSDRLDTDLYVPSIHSVDEAIERLVPGLDEHLDGLIDSNSDIVELLVGWINGERSIEELPEEIAELLVDAEIIAQLAIEIQQLLQRTDQSLDNDELNTVAQKLYQLLGSMRESDTDLKRVNWDQFIEKISSKEVADIWKDVSAAYEKRSKFAAQAIYQTDATITRDTVANWLEQALARHFVDEKQTQTIVQPSTMPMSTLQQYTIHLSSTERIEAISNELVNKLSNVMKQSQFLKTPGLHQLSIRLAPDNLGEMTIRFMQVNGEMTVKFLVSSQFTKQLLESNMHQLKSMFAPHQITIERDTTIVTETNQLEEEQEPMKDEQDELQEEEQLEEDAEEVSDIQFEELLQMLRKEELVT